MIKFQALKVDKQELLDMLPNVDIKSQVETCVKIEIAILSKAMDDM